MAKFKVGDKVRVTGLDQYTAAFDVKVGMTGTVVVPHHDWGYVVGVKIEEPIFGNSLYYKHRSTLKGGDVGKGMWIEPENLELIEEPKMTQQFKNMKIRIKDPVHSSLVQEALFEMGCRWQGSGDQSIHDTSSNYLYVDDYFISHGTTYSTFENEGSEEVELVTTYSFKPVDQEAKRKAAEKEALQKNVAEMQKQLDEMKQKLESMT